MQLILWRHAEAEDGPPDLSRELTAKGQTQAQKMADFLRDRLPHDTRILVSPAARTQQTAQALQQPYLIAPAILPGCTPHTLLQAAGWGSDTQCTLIVGHQPSLGGAASLLLTGHIQYWSIKKGAIWWFGQRQREEATSNVLRLCISPDLL